MNENEKREYLERYRAEKEKGVPFFPDILFKDALVSLLVFVLLVVLAYFVGAPLEERANPADTTYNPRPEWYFLFLFQLLKYFPGNIEFVGVVIIPMTAIALLVLLPFLDRSPRRHYLGRPVITAAVGISAVSFIALSYIAVSEIPPSVAATSGDPTAMLYVENCAGCHGPTLDVPAGSNLHEIIAQGNHEGMPSWRSDLTTDEIDALAGFILSPGGSALFTASCGSCHEVADLVAIDPLELKRALDEGPTYAAHQSSRLPEAAINLDAPSRTALVNFLVAPDGQRLYTTNCSACHGRSVSYSGTEAELRALISQGGMHLEMPPWREQLKPSELEALARFVVDPSSDTAGERLFAQYCSDCHGARVPAADDVEQARETIASGGSHETMPVWGEVLTAEQLDALVAYTLAQARGSPTEIGRETYSNLCSNCHGDFGEGGYNPSRPDDIIAPISSSEYLATRDDATLRAIISRGQPTLGMSPFSSAFGGPLDDEDIEAVIAFMRSWEASPPVEQPPELEGRPAGALARTGPEIYEDLCEQCHGPEGQGGLGPALRSAEFQSRASDQDIFDVIKWGHDQSAMIAWGHVLSDGQITELVTVVRSLAAGGQAAEEEAGGGPTSFAADIMPLLEASCISCHGTLGGWDGASYEAVMTTGDHAPVVVPGDADSSLLARMLLGTQKEGLIMPPTGRLDDELIQPVVDWINEGALDN